jgi:hypothetical protein
MSDEIWDINPPMARAEMQQYRTSHNMTPATFNYQEDCSEIERDAMWEAIWDEIKTWDINVPTEYGGYCGATGSHVAAIWLAIRNATLPKHEKCINWPCQLTRAHAGPCSTSGPDGKSRGTGGVA